MLKEKGLLRLNNFIYYNKKGKMGLKTFNVDEEIYREYSKYCREQGISMSKKIDNFIREEMIKVKGKTVNVKEKEILKDIEHSFRRYC